VLAAAALLLEQQPPSPLSILEQVARGYVTPSSSTPGSTPGSHEEDWHQRAFAGIGLIRFILHRHDSSPVKQLFQLKALEEWGAVRALSYTAVAQQYSSSTDDQDDQDDQGDQEEGHKTSVGRIGRGCFDTAAKVGTFFQKNIVVLFKH